MNNNIFQQGEVPDLSSCSATLHTTPPPGSPDYIAAGTTGGACTTNSMSPKIFRTLPTALSAQLVGTVEASIDGQTPTADVQMGSLDMGSNDPYCRSGAPCPTGVLNSFSVATTFINLVVKGKTVQAITVSIPDPIGVEQVATLDGSNFQFELPVGAIFGGLAKVDNQDVWINFTSTQAATGTYNINQGTLTLQFYLQGTVADVTGTLTGSVTTGTVTNRAPHLGTPTFVDTASTGPDCASQVGFTVPAADPDGDSLTFTVQDLPGSVLYSGGASAGGQAAVFSAKMTVGQHSLFIQVDDGKGGEDSFYQTLIVVDVTPPHFTTTPQDVNSAACGQSINIGTATAADNCDTGIPVVVSNNAPATFPLGTTSVVWTARDSSGNTATFVQKVTIGGPPKFVSKPSDINYTACDVPPGLGTARAVDVCGTPVSVSNNAPATFPIGTTTVTWKAADTVGNTATFLQKVAVSAATDLGVEHNISSVKNNACLEVTKYPSWGQYLHALIIQPQANGVGWPIPFSYTNCGTNSGSGSLPGPWQQGTVRPVSASCPTFIKLGGNGAGSVSLTWWGNG